MELRLAAERRSRAEEERRSAAAQLRERIHDAHEAGIAVARIAAEAGLSRQSVYETLGIRIHSGRGRGLLPG